MTRQELIALWTRPGPRDPRHFVAQPARPRSSVDGRPVSAAKVPNKSRAPRHPLGDRMPVGPAAWSSWPSGPVLRGRLASRTSGRWQSPWSGVLAAPRPGLSRRPGPRLGSPGHRSFGGAALSLTPLGAERGASVEDASQGSTLHDPLRRPFVAVWTSPVTRRGRRAALVRRRWEPVGGPRGSRSPSSESHRARAGFRSFRCGHVVAVCGETSRGVGGCGALRGGKGRGAPRPSSPAGSAWWG